MRPIGVDVAAKMDAGLMVAGTAPKVGAETFAVSYKRAAEQGEAAAAPVLLATSAPVPIAAVQVVKEASTASEDKAAGDPVAARAITHVPVPAGVATPKSQPLLPVIDPAEEPVSQSLDKAAIVQEKPLLEATVPPGVEALAAQKTKLLSTGLEPMVETLEPGLIEEKVVVGPTLGPPQKLSGPLQTMERVAATPEKKSGKGPVAPVAPDASQAVMISPVAAPITVNAMPLPTCPEVTPVATAQPVMVAPVPVASTTPAVPIVPVLQSTLAADDSKLTEALGKPQGTPPKKGAALVKEAPVVAPVAAHWDQTVQKPVVHGDPAQAPAQKLEVLTPAPSLGSLVLAPVVTATPLVAGAVPADGGVIGSPAVATAAPVEHEQAVQPGDARTLTSTAQTLEVGVASGTHGWLRVRAEMGSAGEVTASVMATSPVAAEALHRGLPALREFLAHEQMGLVSVAISAPRASADGLAAGVDSQAERQQQRGQQAASTVSTGAWEGDLSEAFTGSFEMPVSGVRSDGGGWLSVRV